MDKFIRKNTDIGNSMLCPVCGGTGKELWKHYVKGKYVEEKVNCEACSGSGYIALITKWKNICTYKMHKTR